MGMPNKRRLGRYSNQFFSHKSKRRIIQALHELGLIEMKIGFYDKSSNQGKLTRIWATNRLVYLLKRSESISLELVNEEELIKLKDSTKTLIEYEDTEETISMRNKLEVYNKLLQRHFVGLKIEDEILIERGYSVYNAPPRLYRVFNNSTFLEGGRFYGGWWQQVSSKLRRYVTINNKATIELDYSNLHPWTLYAKKGKVLDFDAYCWGEELGIDREFVKKTMNAMLNAKSPYLDFKKLGLASCDQLKALQKAIEAKHSVIKDHFYKGAGPSHMREDSDVVEEILMHFAQQGILVLPIHDSFIIEAKHHPELRHQMHELMYQRYGLDIKTSYDSDPEVSVEDSFVEMSDADLMEAVISGHDEHSIYNQSFYDWKKRLLSKPDELRQFMVEALDKESLSQKPDNHLAEMFDDKFNL